ncbi:hypothetical protein L6452_38924 [Arctium lappa]|uniref:Uncharacterized protein n=1 Tax=Arctium lappa TaxID=4217 RepID=A0ACB8XR41_ARCLA|nr:hypothetical protein L6452_38924 [Arctium lappa]
MATVIFVIFVSFGCVFFLGFVVFALCCIVKKLKCSKTADKSELVHVDEHLKVSENAVQGSNGMKVVSITIDDDLHVDEKEDYRKNENKTADKSELVHVDEHLKVSENAVQGSNGMKVVSITIDDDLHVDEKEDYRKNENKTADKSELVHVDEHLKVSENAVQGSNGMKVVSITIDDDLHVDEKEDCRKNEKFGKDFYQTR